MDRFTELIDNNPEIHPDEIYRKMSEEKNKNGF
jgi:hypothetical protein